MDSTLKREPVKLHIIVYVDDDEAYIGMDVFSTFDAALKQFDTRYEETLADHDYDPDCITYYARVPEADELRFTDTDGYEVFYCTEILQEA